MFSPEDRRFLRGIRIDPQEGLATIDELLQARSQKPDTIIIPLALAQAIIARYGKLTFETYLAYYGVRNG